MRQIHLRRPRIGLLDLCGYLVLGGVSLVLALNVFVEADPNRWLALGLLAAMVVVSLLRDALLDRSSAPWLRPAYVALQTALTAALIVAVPHYYSQGFILFFRLGPEAMMLLPRRAAYAWVGVFSVITLITLIWREGPEGAIALPIYFGGYIFFVLFARETARAQQAHCESQRLLAELQAAHGKLQQYALQAEELAVAEERNRLAREMHDTLGHRLTVSAVQLQAAEKLYPTDGQRSLSMVADARGEIRGALDDLRATVATLRSPLEAGLTLGPALRRMAAAFEAATNTPVHLLIPNPLPDLPSAHRQALYRAVQEGLTNIQKHALAHTVWIQLSLDPGEICLIVRDDGRGPAPEGQTGTGFGLTGLRERAAQLGGSARLEARAGGGSQLVISLPLAAEIGEPQAET